MKFNTVNEAAHEWVKEFNSYPIEMVRRFSNIDSDEMHEVTEPSIGSCVYVYESGHDGEIVAIEEDEDGETIYTVNENGVPFESLKLTMDDFEVMYDDIYPMWGWMWQMTDPCDVHWIEEGEGIKVLSECGFRVYEHDEFGYFFGIDGCGYDFYESHWEPLYLKRGLKWHKDEE